MYAGRRIYRAGSARGGVIFFAQVLCVEAQSLPPRYACEDIIFAAQVCV